MDIEHSCKTEIANVYHAGWIGSDRFVLATSTAGMPNPDVRFRSHLLWCKLAQSGIEVIGQSEYDGRIMAVFPFPANGSIVVHWEADINRDYRIEILNKNGNRRGEHQIPYSWANQLSSTASGSFITACGNRMPGYPVDSSLIEASTGVVRRLPYPACVLYAEALYFLYSGNLRKQPLLAGAFPDDNDASVVCDHAIAQEIISLLPEPEGVCLFSEDAVLKATSNGVVVRHKWQRIVSRVLKCGHICFARSVGSVVQVWDEQSDKGSDVLSSSGKQVHGFDATMIRTSDGVDEGKLILVSEPGVVDVYAWYRKS